ncbi:MAG: DUF2177 family protein [Acidobacteria bacterium]|nr:MAG: DUF2177 family protein [Acidobacteriota bacterium]REK06379.1 MAG: DUF2177 family protein [Acidobacteriota bacterium]
MIFTKAFVGSLAVFLVLDLLWLRVITRDYYPRQIGHLMAENAQLGAAAVFYLVYLLGLVHLAVLPAVRGGGWSEAALSGAVLGLVAYGTYGFTNLAVLREWPLAMTLVDTAWGVVLTGLASLGGFWAAQWGR